MRNLKRSKLNNDIQLKLDSKIGNVLKSEKLYEEVKKVSNGTCYICNCVPRDVELEHRIGHRNSKKMNEKFDWNNLFYSCVKCNNNKIEFDNKDKLVFDPTDTNCDVEYSIKYEFDNIDCTSKVIEAHVNYNYINKYVKKNKKEIIENAEVTCKVINKKFAPKSSASKSTLSINNEDLNEELNSFFMLLKDFQKNKDKISRNKILKDTYKHNFEKHLNESYKYAGIKRSFVKNNLGKKFLIDLITN